MKRLFLIVLTTVLVIGNTFAQHKPTKGSWSTEVQINPFDQDGETFTLEGLKVRYFFNEKNAIRLKVGFSITNSKFTDENPDEEEGIMRDYEYNYQKGYFNIDLGYERHFNLGKRLNAYLGGSIGVGKNFASTDFNSYTKYTYPAATGILTNETFSEGELKNGIIAGNPSSSNNIFDYAERATFNINAAIFAGLDFYIYKGIYIGTELGIGGSSHKDLKMEINATTTTIRTNTNGRIDRSEDVVEMETTDNNRTTNFRTYIEPRLRIGITF